jgi:hypothetical protein
MQSDAGLVQLVEQDDVISREIRFTPSIGDTPGTSASLRQVGRPADPRHRHALRRPHRRLRIHRIGA